MGLQGFGQGCLVGGLHPCTHDVVPGEPHWLVKRDDDESQAKKDLTLDLSPGESKDALRTVDPTLFSHAKRSKAATITT